MSLLGLLTLVLLLVCNGDADYYNIVPNYTIEPHCSQWNEPCFTLKDFAKELFYEERLSLHFLPGEHALTEQIAIDRIRSVTMTGDKTLGHRSVIQCQGTLLSGFLFEDVHTIRIEWITIMDCVDGEYGSAISINGSSDVTISNSHFVRNLAKFRGGAIYMFDTLNAIVQDTTFIYNSVAIPNNYYEQPSSGGAMYFDSQEGLISICGCQFINNTAAFGGAISVNGANVSIKDSRFIHNAATSDGGAMRVKNGTLSCNATYYLSNIAGKDLDASGLGGAMSLSDTDTFSSKSTYLSNTAGKGGAIISLRGKLSSNYDQFENNTANEYGGAVNVDACELLIKSSHFGSNKAPSGGAFAVRNSQLTFCGDSLLTNNVASVGGGAIVADHSQIVFNSTSIVSIRNNTARLGGGIVGYTGTSMRVYGPIEITDNTALEDGGGVYAQQSEIQFSSNWLDDPKFSLIWLDASYFDNYIPKKITSYITNNKANGAGGGMYLKSSTTKISQSLVHFNSNRAKGNGGALFLEQSSKIHLYQINSLPEDKIELNFTENSASKGGAIFVSDKPGKICEGLSDDLSVMGTTEQECFIQTLRLLPFYVDLTDNPNLPNSFFKNNTATLSGNDIYGGLLDRCIFNPQIELFDYSLTLTGFDYIKLRILFDGIVDYKHLTAVELLDAISRTQVNEIISSDAVQVVFCLENKENYTSNEPPNVVVKKGEQFMLSIVAVDQLGNPVKSYIVSSVHSSSGKSRLKEGQTNQEVSEKCTLVEYNVYSEDNSAQLQLYANGPCQNLGVSNRIVNITFSSCICPIGFQPLESNVDCICDCDPELKQYQITNCSVSTETLLIETNIWIGLTNRTGYIVQVCSFDYCVERPVNISLKSSHELDKQCAYNRTGNLCGECEEGLSLVFASSRCMECSDYFLLLLIPFAVIGIVLIVFILLLNITVATGTIHGLIFYANIVAANRSIFLPFKSPNFLTVFIAWLNLDWGIETCFYNEMTSQSKLLLQLVFPMYLFFLLVLIIVLCKYSSRFSTLLANRNPVATLCTLVLLSYSKLLRMIITALQYTYLNYPDDAQEIVWLYDANVQYFSVHHIPRFIVAVIIITLGGLYTVLLFFGQWLHRFSNWKLMKWTRNTKYNAFIDAYHAPFKPKHRYWMGLLLLSLIFHNLVAAIATDSSLPVLSAGCLVLGLMLIKLLTNGVYKDKLQESLETFFLLNLVVLAIATFYVQAEKKNQEALIYTSMAISFILFMMIVCFHCHKYILKGWIWAKLLTKCRALHARNKHEMYQMVHDVDNGNDDGLIEEPYYDQPRDSLNLSYTGEPKLNEQADIQRYHTPPIIRPAVRYDQLREPDLDILDPITTDDYRVHPPRPRIHEPPVITYTVIEAPRRRVGSEENA